MKTPFLRRLLTVSAALAIPAAAQLPAGALDVTFNGGGWAALTPVPADDFVYSTVVQPDGKILIGSSRSNPGGAVVTRRHPDTSLDLSFNGTGTAIIGPAFGAQSLTLRNDGRILVGSATSLNYKYLAGCLLTDGSPDPSFGSPGTGYTTAETAGAVQRLAVQPDGKVLAVSYNQMPGPVVRFLSNGTVDTTFGSGGSVTLSTAPLGFADIQVQPDGRILLCHFHGAENSTFGITRLLPGGSLDPAFGEGGTILLSAAYPLQKPLFCRRLTVTEDGKILVAGSSGTIFNTPGAERTFVLVRLRSDGIPDASFGDPDTPGMGRIFFEPGNTGLTAFSMLRLRDKTVIVAGTVSSAATKTDIALARFTEDGKTHTGFGDGGRVVQDFDLRQEDVVDAMILPSVAPEAQKILVCGNQFPHAGGSPRLFLARFIALPGAFLHAEYPPGRRLPWESPAVVNLGPVTVQTLFFEIAVENAGSSTLTNIHAAIAGESHPGTCQVTLPPAAASLAPGAKVSALVSFTPSAPGVPHTATLTFTSATPGFPPRVISLTGSKATPLQAWRVTWFGSPDNSGSGADLNDFDGDGLPNFMEYATAGNPHHPSPSPLHPVPAATAFTYTRPAAALTDFSYTPESAPSPDGPWSSTNLTSTILTDDGTVQTIRVTPAAPLSTFARLFLRLRVTRL